MADTDSIDGVLPDLAGTVARFKATMREVQALTAQDKAEYEAVCVERDALAAQVEAVRALCDRPQEGEFATELAREVITALSTYADLP